MKLIAKNRGGKKQRDSDRAGTVEDYERLIRRSSFDLLNYWRELMKARKEAEASKNFGEICD